MFKFVTNRKLLTASSLLAILTLGLFFPLPKLALANDYRPSELASHLKYLFSFQSYYEVSLKAIATDYAPYGFVLDEKGLQDLRNILHQAESALVSQQDSRALIQRYNSSFEVYELAVTKQIDQSDLVWLKNEILKKLRPGVSQWLSDLDSQGYDLKKFAGEWPRIINRFAEVDKNPSKQPGKVHEVLTEVWNAYSDWVTALTGHLTQKDEKTYNNYVQSLRELLLFAHTYFSAEIEDISRAVNDNLPQAAEDLAYLKKYQPVLDRAQQAFDSRDYIQTEQALTELDRSVFKKRMELGQQFRLQLIDMEGALTSWLSSIRQRIDAIRSRAINIARLEEYFQQSQDLLHAGINASSRYCGPFDACSGEAGPLNEYDGYLALAKFTELTSLQEWWEQVLKNSQSPSLNITIGPQELVAGGVDAWTWGSLELTDMHIPILKKDNLYYMWMTGWFSDEESQAHSERYSAALRLSSHNLDENSESLRNDLSPNPSIANSLDKTKPYAVPVLKSKHTVPMDGPLGTDYTSEDTWIGGVWYNETTQELLGFVHMEDYYAPNIFIPWYGSIGLVVSKDFGKTFSRPQKILTSPLSFEMARTTRDADGNFKFIGHVHPTVVPVTESNGSRYLYLYSGYDGVGITVARSKIDGERTGRPETWQKYYNGSWGEPGLGGLASKILGEEVGGASMTASYNDYLKNYMLVFVNDTLGKDNEGIYVTTSADGLRWSEPKAIIKGNTSVIDTTQPAINFPSLIGRGKKSTQETSKENWLFYMHQEPTGQRTLLRTKVTFGF